MKKKRQEEIKEAGRRRRKEGEREKKERERKVRSGRKNEEREKKEKGRGKREEGERKRNCSLFLFLAGGSECAEEAGCPGMWIFTVFRVCLGLRG